MIQALLVQNRPAKLAFPCRQDPGADEDLEHRLDKPFLCPLDHRVRLTGIPQPIDIRQSVPVLGQVLHQQSVTVPLHKIAAGRPPATSGGEEATEQGGPEGHTDGGPKAGPLHDHVHRQHAEQSVSQLLPRPSAPSPKLKARGSDYRHSPEWREFVPKPAPSPGSPKGLIPERG